MMTHRKIHAQDHFQFNCGYCDRKFEKEDELVAHGKLRGRTYQCEMCCHSFNKADYLDNHNRRNHWKELGLEQLKIAPPKNGWNRKGVPKPKRKGFEEDGGEVALEMEPLEVAYNVNVPPISETYIDYVEAPQPETSYTEYSVPQDPQLDVESLCQIAKNECDSDFKTNSLEVEHILPDETPHGVVQQEYRLESDHDYVGDDFHYEDDSVKNDVPDEGDEELKTEIKNEPEVIQDSPMVCPVPTEVPTEPDKGSIVDAVPKLEDPEQKEEIEKVADIADVGSDTDDDDKPLSVSIGFDLLGMLFFVP